jgi:L-histidine Nalpha-methyltransferase
MTSAQVEKRFTLVKRPPPPDSFAHDVEVGLTASPKKLSCRHFYNEEGSDLFEAISRLPEYYLTRTEAKILRDCAAEMVASLPNPVSLVELGSGSATKTRLLIEALLGRQGRLLFAHVDISPSALEASSRQLLAAYEGLEVVGAAAEYEQGLALLGQYIDGPRLVLWLGSSVGNFEADEASDFLRQVAASLDRPGDRLLIGMDLHKDRGVLERAYDDAEGVTAAFNRNLLLRINRELGGRFEMDAFGHRSLYDEDRGRVEMHLVSRQAQQVPIEALGLEISFAAGETIHTENCHKYRPDQIGAFLHKGGLELERQFFDSDRHFSLNLARPVNRG